MEIKVKVIKRFKNKYSKKVHEVGDILDVSDSRYQEINSTKHGNLVEEIKGDTKTEAGEEAAKVKNKVEK